jgi:hypothetical protein
MHSFRKPFFALWWALLLGMAGGCAWVPRDVQPPDACTVPDIDTSDWQLRSADAIHFRLPPDFVRHEPEGLLFQHGGTRYVSGRRTFDLTYGVWSEDSFRQTGAAGGHSECMIEVDGRRVLVITRYERDRYRAMAWPVVTTPADGFGYSEAFFGESRDRADVPVFLAAFRTLRFPEPAD